MEIAEKITLALEVPPEHSNVPVEDVQGQFMYDLIREHGLKDTLEVGLGYGKATAYIMSATGRKHVAIDPMQDVWGNRGLGAVQRLGLEHNLEFHREYSHFAMPELARAGRRFDFIFIDGDHKFDYAFVDFHFAHLMLNQGGFVMFHDTWMRSICMIEGFIKHNRKEYRPVKTPGVHNIVLFQKVAEDQRSWMHFREFYTLRSLLKFRRHVWRLGG